LRTNSKLRKDYNDKTIERRVALEDYEVQNIPFSFVHIRCNNKSKEKIN
jgi:hypothetical protein